MNPSVFAILPFHVYFLKISFIKKLLKQGESLFIIKVIMSNDFIIINHTDFVSINSIQFKIDRFDQFLIYCKICVEYYLYLLETS